MSALGRYLGLVKFEHTLFALPFALIGLLVATDGRPPGRVLLWVVVAMVGARSAAMAFNRLVDREYDRRNPRTADRHLPAGAMQPREAALFTVLAAAVFVLAAGRLNPLCLALSPVALGVILLYSYTKRFTEASHLVLGLSLAIAPVGAWLAATGRFAPFPLWTAAGVLCWVAGFDTIYACQDVDFDRRAGLRSLAARFGVRRALLAARGLHVAAVVCLAVAVTRAPELGAAARAGVAVMAALLVVEHRLVRGGDLAHIDRAFFTLNSWIGVVLLAAVALDLYLL
ncbi:MAG: UbiA-like polyprenyltransferase [Candidatus Krumholzibacteriia bacterium]